MQIEYVTGREYDGEQVLNIIVEKTTNEEFEGYVELVATFTDSSRHIKGRVVLPMMNTNYSTTLLGRETLANYDLGFYEPL